MENVELQEVYVFALYDMGGLIEILNNNYLLNCWKILNKGQSAAKPLQGKVQRLEQPG